MSLVPKEKILHKGNLPKHFDFQEGAVLLIDKPGDWTSFDVVNKIRFKIKYGFGYKKIKVGHAGTLDPLATGLLIVCTGKFTKKIDKIQNQPKKYSGEIVLGKTTPTYDGESEADRMFPISHIDEQLVEEVKNSFIGEQFQVPPIYSAIKIKGQTAYSLARRGEDVILKARKVEITSLETNRVSDEILSFHIHCSKGTYIRSLAHDMGQRLDSGAYLGKLRREEIGIYSVQDALSIEEIVNYIEGISPI
jgi:tRNA pseudouridine55 synthase